MKNFKSKSVFYLIMLFITCFVVSCNKNQAPYDHGFSSEEWTPSYLLTEVSDSGVWLLWEQPVENIDGFILERSADSINWEFLSKKMIESEIREYLDSSVVSGEVIFYRIYAKAGSNISDYCFSDVVIIPLQLPSVVTLDATEIKTSSARFNGAVTKDGGKLVTERGFCYRFTEDTISNEIKVAVGEGIGAFTKEINRLRSGFSYIIRAYASNENGTKYGNEKSFTASGEIGCTDWDGKTYKTVTIGTQTWMAENLAYLPLIDDPKYSSQDEPKYYVYGYVNNNIREGKATTNYKTYGVLYNWQAALISCPGGWHLPCDEEWLQLENYLILNGFNYDETITNNKIGKSLAANSFWELSSFEGAIGNNLESNNKSGFAALPGGYHFRSGSFLGVKQIGYWWSENNHDENYSNFRSLSNNSVEFYQKFTRKENGLSVRCVKD